MRRFPKKLLSLLLAVILVLSFTSAAIADGVEALKAWAF